MAYGERSYGAKYADMGGRYFSAAAIAKLMREDIKAEIAAGKLPGSMKNYSVKVQNYSGGRSIRIRAIDLEGLFQDCQGYRESKVGGRYGCGHYRCAGAGEGERIERVLNAEGQRIEEVLKAVHAAYNHDGSDSMVDYFDVNYYGDAQVEDERSAKFRASEKERLAARKAAKAAV